MTRKYGEIKFYKLHAEIRETYIATHGNTPPKYRQEVEIIWDTIHTMLSVAEWRRYEDIPQEIRVKILRLFRYKRHKLTQKKFANKIPGCHQPKISLVLNGKKVLSDTEFIIWLEAFGKFRTQSIQ